MTTAETWRHGLGMGQLGGLCAVALGLLVDPAITPGAAFEILMGWTVAGWVVLATESGLRPLSHGMAVTTLLNLSYLLDAASAGSVHVVLLALTSVVFGAAFGLAKWHLSQPRGFRRRWV